MKADSAMAMFLPSTDMFGIPPILMIITIETREITRVLFSMLMSVYFCVLHYITLTVSEDRADS